MLQNQANNLFFCKNSFMNILIFLIFHQQSFLNYFPFYSFISVNLVLFLLSFSTYSYSNSLHSILILILVFHINQPLSRVFLLYSRRLWLMLFSLFPFFFSFFLILFLFNLFHTSSLFFIIFPFHFSHLARCTLIINLILIHRILWHILILFL